MQGHLVKTTLVDYPGRVAAALFIAGCNLRCPYCYNHPLVTGLSVAEDFTLDQVVSHLTLRRSVLSGFVLSGGEALLCPELPSLIRVARSLGYKIKLDTNGTLNEKLKALLETAELSPDFIALDIKTSPERYCELSEFPDSTDKLGAELEKSVALVGALPPDSREFRTVLVPGLVRETEIREIASMLPKDAAWRFAPFRNRSCLDARYNAIAPYTEKETENLVKIARGMIIDTAFR